MGLGDGTDGLSSCNLENPFGEAPVLRVRERDLDLLLAEEITASSWFAGWLTYDRTPVRIALGTAALALGLATLALAGCSGGDDGGGNDAARGDQVTGDEVVAAFQAAGLEAEDPRPMTVDEYGFAPYVCDGTRFLIPSLGEDSGGRVFICDDEDEQESLGAYYEDLGEGSAAFFSWVFEEGNALVQINGDLDEATARRYEAAIP